MFLIYIGYILLFLNCAKSQEILTSTQCLNDETSLLCPQCVIHIHEALYGHPTPAPGMAAAKCSGTAGVHNQCYTNASDVRTRCEGQSSCVFTVRQERGGTDCRQPSNYLIVKYSCDCSVSCARLPVPKHGGIEYSSEELSFGTTAEHTCTAPWELVGPRQRQCQVNGQWTNFTSSCALPSTYCPMSKFAMQPYGDHCFEFVDTSVSWSDASHACTALNGTVVYIDSPALLEFLEWWLDKLMVHGYVWVHDVTFVKGFTQSSDMCLELYRNKTQNWEVRSMDCDFQNQFICQYESSSTALAQNPDFMTILIISLCAGLAAVILIAVIIGVIICCCRSRCSKSSSLSEAEGKSTNNLVECGYDNESGTSPEDVACPTERHIPMYSIAEEDEEEDGSTTVHYDDVYVSSGRTLPHANGKVKPEVKPKPKVGAKARRTTRHYENVVLHNLAESLKRKIMPRRVARSSSKNKSDAATNGEMEAKQQDNTKNNNVPDKSNVPQTNGTKNGSAAVHSSGAPVEYTQVELRVPSSSDKEGSVKYTEVELGPSNGSARSSGGLEVTENDLYDMQETSH